MLDHYEAINVTIFRQSLLMSDNNEICIEDKKKYT